MPQPQDDRFQVLVPLMSDEYHRIRERFLSPIPTSWPGRDPDMGYWVESITEQAGSAWVTVTVAQAGRMVR